MVAAPLLLLLIGTSAAHNCAGCTPLDSLAFDKVISAFPASLVKFDVAYPYGDDHDEFAKVAKDAAAIEKLFIGEVGIKDYGEKDNEDLAKRFDVKKEDYPAAILFTGREGGGIEHVRFTGKFKAENLKAFVRKHSGISMPLVGCSEELDRLADELVAVQGTERGEVVRRAEAVWDRAQGGKAQKQAEVYVKIMRKGEELGIDFVKKEEVRVKKLLSGKVNKEKKEELEERINILKSFSSGGEGDREEL
jgi:endoplasmic reticulum protein 29